MIREYKKSLHLRLTEEWREKIKSGEYSPDSGCMSFLSASARSVDFDDVDDVTIINERFVLEDFDRLAEGRTVILHECENINDYKDWWR